MRRLVAPNVMSRRTSSGLYPRQDGQFWRSGQGNARCYYGGIGGNEMRLSWGMEVGWSSEKFPSGLTPPSTGSYYRL